MKTNAIIVTLCVSGSIAMGQKLKADKVPAVVKESFAKRFPEAKSMVWELDKNNYEVEFKKGKEEFEAEFDAKGEFIKSETELNGISSLPSTIQEALKKDYAKSEAVKPEKVSLANGKTIYEMEIKIEGKKYELLFEESGVLISKTEDVKSDKD